MAGDSLQSDLDEALAHPQVQALGMSQPVPGEDFTLTALPLSFNGRRPTHASVAPRLGQDNPQFGLPATPSGDPDV